MTSSERESFLASLKAVKPVKSPLAEARPRESPLSRPGPAAAAEPKPQAADAHAGHTSQLLEARKKARKRFDS